MTTRIAMVGARDSLPTTFIAASLSAHGRWPHSTSDSTPVVTLVDRVDDADIAMLSSAWQIVCAQQAEDEARRVIEGVRQMGKRTLVLADFDSTKPLALAPLGGVVYRTSMLAGVTYIDEFARPAFANSMDPDSVPIRGWSPVPVVSFVGQTTSAALASALRARRHGPIAVEPVDSDRNQGARATAISLGSPMNVGLVVRQRAIAGLRSSPAIHASIIERDRFFAEFAPEEKSEHLAEFQENMVNSDYVLCVRGAGNFSYRLYETLAAGRIPVIVDTAMLLPFADRIDWSSIGVWVAMDKLDAIGDRVAAFHHGLGPNRFAALQGRIRSIHQEFLSRSGFARTLFVEELPRLLAKGVGT